MAFYPAASAAVKVDNGRMADTGTSSLHRITQGSRVLGFVSIDSTVQGRARGGLRIAADLSEEEIRSDSRAMTLKYGLLGLPQGGAKAGLVGDGEAPASEKRRLLLEFAHAARPLLLDRRYVPDADLGTHGVRHPLDDGIDRCARGTARLAGEPLRSLHGPVVPGRRPSPAGAPGTPTGGMPRGHRGLWPGRAPRWRDCWRSEARS